MSSENNYCSLSDSKTSYWTRIGHYMSGCNVCTKNKTKSDSLIDKRAVVGGYGSCAQLTADRTDAEATGEMA